MRDPKRIRKILKEIGDIWETYPDLRLGQLLLNIIEGDFKRVNKEHPELDIDIKEMLLGYDREQQLYNIEDDALMEKLRKLYIYNTKIT